MVGRGAQQEPVPLALIIQLLSQAVAPSPPHTLSATARYTHLPCIAAIGAHVFQRPVERSRHLLHQLWHTHARVQWTGRAAHMSTTASSQWDAEAD
jgi:hypothetical protein